MIYGYCRISTPKQNIERQIRNIKAAYPTAVISKEIYTGTKFYGRKELDKILRLINPGDKIIFDSVSRMARNAEEGIALYEELFYKNISLVFLKESHINTDTYKEALDKKIQVVINSGDAATDELMNSIIESLNKYIINLAKQQIKLAFEQAQKEVKDLSDRTKEGLVTAKLNGKQLGLPAGTKLTTKKAVAAKAIIKKHSKSFEGKLTDKEVMLLAQISRGSYYKYKNQLFEEIANS